MNYLKNKWICHLAAISLSGCASSKITGESENPHLAPNKRVTSVAISPFKSITLPPNTNLNTQYLDQKTGLIYVGKKENKPQANKVGENLTKVTKKELERGLGIPVQVSEDANKTDIWISGQLTTEKPGSRALRSLLGLGLGRTTLETRIYIYNLTKSKSTPWLTLWTKGNSGREPGAIFSALPSPIPFLNILGAAGMVTAIANHSNNGLTLDAKRQGKTISKHLIKKLDGTAKHTHL